jgi:hypothetical protein
MNIRTRDATVFDVAKNRDVQILDRALAIADRQRVQQSLRRMLVRPISRVDHGNFKMPSHKFRRARCRMAHHQNVRLHRIERVYRVEQRLALLQARRFGLQIHLVRAKPRRRRAKADPRARRRLEKRQRHGFAAQHCQLF